jgi:hypothetical protein
MELTTIQIQQLNSICEWIKDNEEYMFDDSRTASVFQAAKHFQWLIETQEDGGRKLYRDLFKAPKDTIYRPDES